MKSIPQHYIDPNAYMTTEKAAEYLGIHACSLRHIVAKMLIRYEKKGKRLYFKRVWLDGYIENKI